MSITLYRRRFSSSSSSILLLERRAQMRKPIRALAAVVSMKKMVYVMCGPLNHTALGFSLHEPEPFLLGPSCHLRGW